MAAFPSNTHSFTTTENSNQPTADPFWHSTPRSIPTSPELVMSVSQVVPTPPSGAQQRPVPQQATPARRPQCTHVNMNRLYGQHKCQSCGRVPSIGFVYLCEQDRYMQYSRLNTDADTLPVVADSVTYFDAQAKIAESLGMSKSIIKQILDGEYNFDQIETLLQQRRHVLDTIRRTESASSPSSGSSTPFQNSVQATPPADHIITQAGSAFAPAVQPVNTTSLPMTPAGTPHNTPAISATSTPTTYNKPVKKTGCSFQVCHACRPFFTDRLHMSFDSVFNDEVPPIRDEDGLKHMRVLNADHASNFGLRPPPPSPDLEAIAQERAKMMDDIGQGDGYDDDISTDWTPTDTSSSQNSHFYSSPQDVLPCPGRGLCPVWSEMEGCAYYNGFNDGKRHINHNIAADDPDFELINNDYGAQQPASPTAAAASTPGGTSTSKSSISLPEPILEPLNPSSATDTPFALDLENRLSKVGKAASVTGIVTNGPKPNASLGEPRIKGKDSSRSLGEEVEVDGGVALTEEAVAKGVPDIITSV